MYGSDIIYANPCKSRQELYKAKDAGVRRVTFDSLAELKKIHDILPDAQCILRIRIDDKGASRIPLNQKFGLSPHDFHTVCFRESHLRISGIAFHVGSDCHSVDAYASAFNTVRECLDVLKGTAGFTPSILDIGGGFMGRSSMDTLFKDTIAPFIRREVATLPFSNVIAEPGRFFAEESCTLEVPVIGRKQMPDGSQAITIDDSVYGTFSGVLFDGFQPTFKCISQTKHVQHTQFTIFGRTCDSADRIASQVWLPHTIDEGDVLEVPRIGAYSIVSSSDFNGFAKPTIQVCL